MNLKQAKENYDNCKTGVYYDAEETAMHAEEYIDFLEPQNKEMLEALIENLKESINLEVNRGILLKTAMIHNSHEIDIIEKHTGKTIEEVLK